MVRLTDPLYRIARNPFTNEKVVLHNKGVDKIEYVRMVKNPTYLRHFIRQRNVSCPDCNAIMWIEEKTTGSKKDLNSLKFSNCCLKGQIKLPPPNPLPDTILKLLKSPNSCKEGLQFRTNIRLFNSLLSFTHCNANIDENLISNKGGNYSFRINGTIHHQIPSIRPKEINQPRFAQIYTYDPSFQTNHRSNMYPHLNKDILNKCQDLILQHNPYAEIFKQAGKI